MSRSLLGLIGFSLFGLGVIAGMVIGAFIGGNVGARLLVEERSRADVALRAAIADQEAWDGLEAARAARAALGFSSTADYAAADDAIALAERERAAKRAAFVAAVSAYADGLQAGPKK
jgi:hypothetical protein